MKAIPLTCGRETLVDDEDFDYLIQFNWQWMKPSSGNGAGYAQRSESTRGLDGKRRVIRMHNVIFPPAMGYEVDHKNGDSLDNQRHNLRHATRKQQSMNRALRKYTRGGYKGVVFVPRRNRWTANILVNNRRIHLGTFKTPVAAACAYNKAALIYFGEFARLNPVDNFESLAVRRKP